MTDNQLIIVGLALVGLVFALVLYFVNREWAAVVKEMTRPLLNRADLALAPLGPQLEPIHTALETAEGFVDEPDDWVIQQLAKATGKSPDLISAKLLELFDEAEALTDGVPVTAEPEDAPPQETGDPGGTVR